MKSIEATYFTTSDRNYFVGTVALINSLRLTGHGGEVVVLDLGLDESQRRRLATVATVEPPSVAPRAYPKALPDPGWVRGRIVLLDSDMLVVASLGDVLEKAANGSIRLFPDPDHRWFEEWQRELALKAPLRRERYTNSGFVAFSAEHWPWLLERWSELNEHVADMPRRRPDPYRDPDQDALNALLMSEVPANRVDIQPEWRHAHPDSLPRVRRYRAFAHRQPHSYQLLFGAAGAQPSAGANALAAAGVLRVIEAIVGPAMHWRRRGWWWRMHTAS